MSWLSASQTIAFVATLSITTFALFKQLASNFELPLPPGPPGHWLRGNTIPTKFGYRKFEEWTKEYGPVFTLRQGSQTIIIIGRIQAAIDIMEKDGAHTIDRPRSIAAGETLGGGMRVLMTRPGERYKRMRRALHAYLQPKLITNYGPMMAGLAKQLIFDIMEDPVHHQHHVRVYSTSVVTLLSYGVLPSGPDDPDIRATDECQSYFGKNLRPGYWMVDYWPILRYIPGYLKELQDGHLKELGLFKRKLLEVKDRLAHGEEIANCFGKYILEHQEDLELSENESSYLAGSMYGAGSDTTAAAISITVMAAACYPDVQCWVQEELDQALGKGCAPTCADMELLPRTHAFVLETFRWRPVSAGGFAHKAMKDVIWENYCIPKGATIFGNTWAIGRDPEYFPDPEKFDPRRWIDEEGKVREDLKIFPYGFGRRSVFLNISLILWAMTVKSDPTSPIDQLAFTESVNVHPLPFKVIFEPRVADSYDGIKEMLEAYGT
ncbi:cytochrome P450 [Amanita rubescens]|nr:cytochrome P450 [Amanita rubescens]